MQLPDIKLNRNVGKTITSLLTSRGKILFAETEKVSPNMEVIKILVAKGTKQKQDYAQDLRFLLNHGISLEEAAEKFDMTLDYARKLLKKK